jgi:hypothetical protein
VVVALPGTPETQQAVDGENQRGRWPTYVAALYRLDLKGPGDKVAWIESPSQGDFAPRARPLIQAMCSKQFKFKQSAGVLELAKLERKQPQSRYGWIGQQPSSGFFDMPRLALVFFCVFGLPNPAIIAILLLERNLRCEM